MRITNPKDLDNVLDFSHENAVCSICDEKPHAFWSGWKWVYVCSSCAVEILPKLIADAIWLRTESTDDAKQMLTAITGAYWEGIASRFSYQAKRIRSAGKTKERL